MKLLFCPFCHDIFNLTKRLKKCSCKKTQGKYLEDGLNAEYEGGIPFCFLNNSFVEAMKLQEKQDKEIPEEFLGVRFESFMCPASSDTFKKKKQ